MAELSVELDSSEITLTDEPCCVMFDDNPDEKRAKLPCGCAVGIRVLKDYVEVQQSRGFSDIRCPESDCNWTFAASVVLNFLSTQLAPDELHQLKLKANELYISRPENDIRKCATCKTYCARDLSDNAQLHRNRVRCEDCSRKRGSEVNFCWVCGQEWKSESDVSCGNDNCGGYVAEKYKILAECGTIQKIKYSPVKGCPSVRACPHCTDLIRHNGGCKHMTCGVCRYEFCFVCLADWDEFHLDTSCELADRQTDVDFKIDLDDKPTPSGPTRKHREPTEVDEAFLRGFQILPMRRYYCDYYNNLKFIGRPH